MPFFGSAPSRAAAPSFSPPPTQQSSPLFDTAPDTSSSPLFGASPATSSGPFFGAGPTTGRDPYRGSVSAAGNDEDADNTLSSYHFLTLTPGEEYTIQALREEMDLDPAMWVFSGHSTYEDFLASGELDSGDQFHSGMSTYLGYADDEIDVPGGPHEDAEITITAPDSGLITVVVTNYASDEDDGGDGRFDYRLEVSPDPIDIRVEGEGGTSNPFFGEAPKTSTNPFFGEDDDWLTVTFGDEDNDFIENNTLLLQLVGNGDVIDNDDVVMPMDDGAPPYLALLSNGGFISQDNPFLRLEGEDNPWLPALVDLVEEVGSPLSSGSALLMGFAATGDTQTVTFDWLLDVEDGTHSNSIAFYLTPHGDAGLLGDTQSLTTGGLSGWQTSSVDLQSVTDPLIGVDIMAMFIGVANVGEDFVIEPEGGEIRIEEASPAMLLLDNITLVGVPEGGLSPLPMGVD